MPGTSSFLAFLAAAIALVIVPGPAQALALTQTVAHGPRSGLLTVLGLNAATPIHACAAALGVSALLARSAAAFGVVKLAGAAYLAYRGVVALRRRRGAAAAPPAPHPRAFAVGFLTGALNPKVALFFLAFLPQFVDPARGPVLRQFLVLGAVLAGLDVAYESALVIAASRLGGWFVERPIAAAWRERLSGIVFLALAARVALAKRG